MNGLEIYMSIVAVASVASWIPQMSRILATKSTNDFSLWTTGILAWVNISFLIQALVIEDTPFIIMQSITCFMLGVFTFLVLRYRRW